MDEEIQSYLSAAENLPKRNLSWVDLSVVSGGIVGIYVLLTVITFRIMEWWPHERALMYLNAFLTQLSFVLLIWTLKKIRNWEWADFGWNREVETQEILRMFLTMYYLALWAKGCSFVRRELVADRSMHLTIRWKVNSRCPVV